MDLQGEGVNDSTAHRIDTMLEEGRGHPSVDEPPSIVSYCIFNLYHNSIEFFQNVAFRYNVS